MKIIKPPALKAGECLGIVSLSSPLVGDKKQKYKAGVQYITGMGHVVKASDQVYAQHGYLAGTDDARAQALKTMFQDTDVKAIVCSRGGYGIQRILDRIDFNYIRKHPKIVAGYSDVTALQLALFQKIGLVTFTGPMVAVDMADNMEGINGLSFWNALYGAGGSAFSFQELGQNIEVYRHGTASARLLGGCLSIVCSMLATPYCPDFDNTILLLEDVGEDLYKIDRMFAQLRHSGVLHKIKGLILGEFEGCEDKNSDPPVQLQDIINHYIRDLTVPVIGNVYYGHGTHKHTFPLGIQVRLDTERRELIYLEPAVHV